MRGVRVRPSAGCLVLRRAAGAVLHVLLHRLEHLGLVLREVLRLRMEHGGLRTRTPTLPTDYRPWP